MHVAISHRRLIESWRLLMLRATLVGVLAVAALSWPLLPLASLVFSVSSIALVSGLLDAALFGAFHRDSAGKWALLFEAFVGVTLGGALLVYPLIPLWLVGGLVALWTLGRGAMLAAVGSGEATDRVLRALSLGWGVTSLATAVVMIVAWSAVTIGALSYLLAIYALLWGGLEIVVARRLRARAHVFRYATAD